MDHRDTPLGLEREPWGYQERERSSCTQTILLNMLAASVSVYSVSVSVPVLTFLVAFVALYCFCCLFC